MLNLLRVCSGGLWVCTRALRGLQGAPLGLGSLGLKRFQCFGGPGLGFSAFGGFWAFRIKHKAIGLGDFGVLRFGARDERSAS